VASRGESPKKAVASFFGFSQIEGKKAILHEEECLLERNLEEIHPKRHVRNVTPRKDTRRKNQPNLTFF